MSTAAARGSRSAGIAGSNTRPSTSGVAAYRTLATKKRCAGDAEELRREQKRNRRHDGHGPEHAHDASVAPEQCSDRSRRAEQEQRPPGQPKGPAQTRDEEHMPDVRVGQVLGHCERRRDHVWSGQRKGTELDRKRGQRIAGRDPVAQVPVPTEDHHASKPQLGLAEPPPARRDDDRPGRQRNRGHDHRELGSQGEARRRGGQQTRPGRDRVGAQQQCGAGEQQRDAGHVVVCATRLRVDEPGRSEHDQSPDQRCQRVAESTSDRPGRCESERRPAEVDERRQQVAVNQISPSACGSSELAG